MATSKKSLDRPTSNSSTRARGKHHYPLFSVFDSVAIPYPKREFIVEDDASDTGTAAGTHAIKTESTAQIKTEASSVLHNQQQQQHGHIKQELNNNSSVQQSQAHQVGRNEWAKKLFIGDF